MTDHPEPGSPVQELMAALEKSLEDSKRRCSPEPEVAPDDAILACCNPACGLTHSASAWRMHEGCPMCGSQEAWNPAPPNLSATDAASPCAKADIDPVRDGEVTGRDEGTDRSANPGPKSSESRLPEAPFVNGLNVTCLEPGCAEPLARTHLGAAFSPVCAEHWDKYTPCTASGEPRDECCSNGTCACNIQISTQPPFQPVQRQCDHGYVFPCGVCYGELQAERDEAREHHGAAEAQLDRFRPVVKAAVEREEFYESLDDDGVKSREESERAAEVDLALDEAVAEYRRGRK